MRWPPPFRKIARGLGFRLTAGYIIFFTILLILIGVMFRRMLVGIQEDQFQEVIEGDWTALKQYLQVTNGKVTWTYDPKNPREAFTLERLKRVFLLTDEEGHVLEASAAYRVIGPDPPAEIREALKQRRPVWTIRYDPWGLVYLVRSGMFLESGDRRYYAAVGRSVGLNQALIREFTWQYFISLPVIVLIGGVLGWFLTKRAMRPLQDLVRTSESITGSNLSLRIPLRGAGDELDQLIDTFNRMIRRLESSFQHMRQFTTDVSHELRTPITTVRGQLEVALMTGKREEDLREAIQTALEETERLSNLVKAMLALSQAESGQTTLRKKRLNLSTPAQEILEQFQIPAEEAGVRLVTDLPPGCEVEVDPVQFDRLVSNLVSNAVSYTPAGGEVRLALKPLPGSVKLIVEDTGRGISAEHLPHIFERFYRVPGMDNISGHGMGLGLSFVAWIVKAHGGTIDVTSSVPGGSRFVVTLPRVAAQTDGMA